MIRPAPTLGFVLVAGTALFSCTSESLNPGGAEALAVDGSFPAAVATTLVSASGALQVAVRTDPQPPGRGLNDAQYIVTSTADGTPVDGLELKIVPWMPSMNHGTSLVPTITPQGGGVYVVANLDLFMEGLWQLRTSFSASSPDAAPGLGSAEAGAWEGDTFTDNVTPAFQIP